MENPAIDAGVVFRPCGCQGKRKVPPSSWAYGCRRGWGSPVGLSPPPPLCPLLLSSQKAARKEFATGNPIRLEAGLLPPFRSDELHVMRTSNILNIEPKPFDPELFREEEGEDFDAGAWKGTQNSSRRKTLPHGNLCFPTPFPSTPNLR